MRLTADFLKDLSTHPYVILNTLTIKDITSIVQKANMAYHAKGIPLLTDDIYELVKEYLRKLDPQSPIFLSDVGGAPKAKERVKLPVWMGSMNKLKEDPAAIDRWRSRYPGPAAVSDKLDGISCLFHTVDGQTILYTRGDGTYGQNISHLVKYIQGIPASPKNQTQNQNQEIMVRGELILPKAAWNSIKDLRNNPRNTVAGIANAKKPDPVIASLIHFVAYDCIEPRLAPTTGIAWMAAHGFKTVYTTPSPLPSSQINTTHLSEILIDRRSRSPYEVDGIIVHHDAVHDTPEGDNPAYAFAFKSILTNEQAEVIVKEVQWNVSKNGLLKPVVQFDTVYISGAHLHRATAHNAQYILKHGIGPGARIVVIRSGEVIPYILSITSPAPAGPSLPDPIEYPWKWTPSDVDLVLINPALAHEWALRQLQNYTGVFNIKGLGSKLIKRLYDAGIDNIKKLANITKIELYKATRSADITQKIYKQLQDIFSKGRCIEFMAASNIFGPGLGQSKLKLITEALPETLEPPLADRLTLATLLSIKGIGERNARQFLEHLPDFHIFMEDAGLPCRSSAQEVTNTPEGCMSLQGKNIAFTGFRSIPLAEYIEKHGGKVTTSVSHRTHILIARFVSDDSSKAELARELGIPIMDSRTFEEEVGFVRPTTAPAESESNADADADADAEFQALKEALDEESPMSDTDAEDAEDAEDGSGSLLNKAAECTRHAMNWSNMKRSHVFGKSAFNAEEVAEDLPAASPKLAAIIDKISSLDKKDLAKYGKTFKHMIFSDVYKRGFGAKIIASALTASGFRHAYNQDFKFLPSHPSPPSPQNPNKSTFAILAQTQIYTKPINTSFKQELLKRFNARPDNIYGEKIRIIVLDQGYKEGIDLFDIKYVHLFEPMLTVADKMQAMGRAMRFCGQRGLHFIPDIGWRVHIYDYDHIIPNPADAAAFGGTSSINIILNQMKKDEGLAALTHDIERAAQVASVDRLLNRNIHAHLQNVPPPSALQNQINISFKDCKWPPVKIENLCAAPPPGSASASASALPDYSPSQNFIRNYFQPGSAERGMLLWHSLGSGKTCTALAAASYAWEANGYTIMWITRGTLRSDVYKNMFDLSCVDRIRDYVKSGHKLPGDLSSRKRLLSKSWMPPVSFRQMNNTLKRNNRLFDFLVKRNGYADPFKKTLMIIDEAHLMLSPTMKEKDKPDLDLLKAWLRNSYKTSGSDSARIMLMSATPITTDPYSFMRLINLTAPSDIPETPEAVAASYIDPKTLLFTPKGLEAFVADTAGRISYLNRMRDVRQFAQPILHTVNVPISLPPDTSKLTDKIATLAKDVADLQEIKVGELKKTAFAIIDKTLEEKKKECEGQPKPADKRACIAAAKAAAKDEKESADKAIRDKVANAKQDIANAKERVKALKVDIVGVKKNDNSILTALRKRCFPPAKQASPSIKSSI